MYRYAIAALLCGLLCSAPLAQAQDDAAAAPAPAAPTYSETHRAAAERALLASNIRENLAAGVDTAMAMQVQRNPHYLDYADIMREYMQKYMSWDYMREDLIQLYCAKFSADELQAIATFMESPAGQRYVAVSNELADEISALSSHAMAENVAQLQLKIAARQRELSEKIEAEAEALSEENKTGVPADLPEQQELAPQD